MNRAPKKSFIALRAELPPEHREKISVQLLSDYINGHKRPGVGRSIVLGAASARRGLNVTASDWIYAPGKIKQALINQGAVNA